MNKVNLHPTTFGSSGGAKHLADMLNKIQNPALVTKVSSYLTHSNRLAKATLSIPDASEALAFNHMLADKIKRDVKSGIPERVFSFAKNVAMSKVLAARETLEARERANIRRIDPDEMGFAHPVTVGMEIAYVHPDDATTFLRGTVTQIIAKRASSVRVMVDNLLFANIRPGDYYYGIGYVVDLGQ